MSQKQRILNYLKLNGHLCSLAPFDWTPPIRRVAARLGELKDAGHPIETDTCRLHPEGVARHVVYRLVDERLFA